MSEHRRFRLRSLEELRAELARLGLELPIAEDFKVLAEPVVLGRHTAPNRFGVQPMEGFDATPDGAPGELSFRRYKRYAAGGAGFIWFEATAVLDEARSNPGQFHLHAGTVDVFRRLVKETRQAAREALGREPVLILQLTHSGRYSKPQGTPRPLIAHHSAVLDPLHALPADYPLLTDEYLDRLPDVFVGAARLAAQAGFDAVDVKACHRYLMSELLASFTRPGRYGGTFENRTRLLRETLARIKADVPALDLATRLNVYDAIPYPYGFGTAEHGGDEPDLREPLELARLLRELGLAMLNVSIGNPYYNPHVGRPYDFPIKGGQPPDVHPLEGVVRFIGLTRQVQQAFPGWPVVGSGYSWLRNLMPYVAAGVVRSGWATLIGQGRGAFAYPDSVNDILRDGQMDPAKTCVACSGCTQIMRDGGQTGCVVRDTEVYGPRYRQARRFAPDRLREEARRCRDCLQAACSAGCPAGVDVPAFLRAFAEGDIAGSYAVLRAANVLPELCGQVCPSEVQCEGHCLEKAFTGLPISIRDIQYVVSRTAREKGLAGVELPRRPNGKSVAIVGGGPAGLACAIKLLEAGFLVTLFDKGKQLGGTPNSLIPASRLAETAPEIEAVLRPGLEAKRLTLRLGEALGREVALPALRKEFHAVFLALGLTQTTQLGRGEGIVDALNFLWQAKKKYVTGIPARVAVLGGGNTALDAALTARQLGAKDVYLVYRRSFAEMPAWPGERAAFLEAGGHVLILTQPLGYLLDGQGHLTGVRIIRTELGEPDDSGRRRPIAVPGSESVLAVELAIEALGLAVSPELREALTGLPFEANGLLHTEPGSHYTGVGEVYAGGDLINGGTTAVQGIADGMAAAEEIVARTAE